MHRLLGEARYEMVPVPGAWERAVTLPRRAKVTVTCSPARGLGPTLELTERLAQEGFDVVPHLAARAVTGEAELRDALARLDEAGIRDALVVGGDGSQPAGPYASGADLLRAMDRLGHPLADIGVPGYPEGHPILDDGALNRALREKAAFATYIVTQMCFDAAAIADWLGVVRERDIALPVYLGLPGVVDPRRLARVSAKVGVGQSARYARKNARALWRLLRPGGYRADKLLHALATQLPSGAELIGVHLFTFNEAAATHAWVKAHTSASPLRVPA